MTTQDHGAEREVAFLRNLQRLLSEGDFSATYKFALLQALADLAVERAPRADGTLTLALDDIAEKFIEYYWRQVAPYVPARDDVSARVLQQNTGRQAKVVADLARISSQFGGSLVALRLDARAWRRTVRRVAHTIDDMPLWKLQVVGGEANEFLYRRADYRARTLHLIAGVAEALRDFHPLVSHLVRGAWLDQIRRIGRNRSLLGSAADLHEFLFGSERQNLDRYRAILREYQSARCFYCGKERRDPGEADHFIPWARYPIDLGHNFVFTCGPCNHAKRDFLAGADHLARWRETNLDRGLALSATFAREGLPCDIGQTRSIAEWAYEQAELSDANVWMSSKQLAPIKTSWRAALL